MSEAHDHGDHSDHAGHSHGHGHGHAPKNFGPAFAIGVTLNLGFVIVEAVYGFLSNSMALLADAGHNFSDVLGLLIAWAATILAKRKPGGRYSYGLRSSSIVAALINALFLLVAITIIAVEAVRRFAEPATVAGQTVIIVAAIGIVINTVTALMFMRGSKGDINIRGAFLHMAADAAVSAGVVDRPCCQPCDRCGHRHRHLGAAPGIGQHEPSRHPAGRRSDRGRRVSESAARSFGNPRLAYLVDEHH
jgi:cobalt-zinc-cadmium efflux system protein